MASTELTELTDRQLPIDANILHTFGQLLATVVPLVAVQGLGILSLLSGVVSVLMGVITVGVVSSIFASQTTLGPNLSFGILSGGTFSYITNHYEKSILNQNEIENVVDSAVSIKVHTNWPGHSCSGGRCGSCNHGKCSCNRQRSCGIDHGQDCNGRDNCGTSSLNSDGSVDTEAEAIVVSATPMYKITCSISLPNGVNLANNCANNSGNCLIIAAAGGFDVIPIPACSTSVMSPSIFIPGSYFVQANVNVGGTAYNSPQQFVQITSSDQTVNLELA